jgi:hypothetical protein
MILQQTTKTATYSLLSLIFTVIIGFGVMFFSPEKAYAADTTYYVPMQGYYLGENGLPIGMNWVCSNGSCMPSGAYDAANSRGINTGMTNPRYATCTSAYCQYYGSNYTYAAYVPDVLTNNGNTGRTNQQAYTPYQYTNYPYPTYVSDGKKANTTTTATAAAGTNRFIPTTNTAGTTNGANGGFIMTGN